MFKIFLCYRTSDSRYASGHIYEKLAEEFGSENIFEYNDAMPAGVDFRQHVIGLLQNMQVFLPLIGANWAGSRDEKDQLRLQQPDDPVRVEIETALANDRLRIIPVFLDGIPCPDKDKLPDVITGLLDKSAIHIGYKPDDLKKGVERLIEEIKTEGIHPRPDPTPEIKQLKNKLIELESAKSAKEPVYKRKRVAWTISIVAAFIMTPVFLYQMMVLEHTSNALDTFNSFMPSIIKNPTSSILDSFTSLTKLIYTVPILCVIVFYPGFLKKKIAQLESEILATKSRLIELEGKAR